jgi:hypothetical protein
MLDGSTGRPRADARVIALGVVLVVVAAVFWVVAPTGRVVFDAHRVPPISKRDVVALGLVAAGALTLVSSTGSSAIRRLVGLAAIAAGAAWMLTSHRFVNPVLDRRRDVCQLERELRLYV